MPMIKMNLKLQRLFTLYYSCAVQLCTKGVGSTPLVCTTYT